MAGDRLPLWVFYKENPTPKEGEMFVVEKVEGPMKDFESGEMVMCVTMRRFRLETLDPQALTVAYLKGAADAKGEVD